MARVCASLLILFFAVAAQRPASADTLRAYLYLAVNHHPGRYTVGRYLLNDGEVSGPDLTITSGDDGFNAAMAVGAHGDLYLIPCAGHACGQSVEIFAQGATHPKREILFPPARPSGVLHPTSIAVDPAGFVYVGYYVSIPSSGARSVENGVLVYGPDARGSSPPVTTIKVHAPPYGLTVDDRGDLWVTLGTSLEAYRNASSAPKLWRSLELPGSIPATRITGIAVRSGVGVFASAPLQGSSTALVRYDDSSRGFVAPQTMLFPLGESDNQFATPYFAGGSLVLVGSTLFAVTTASDVFWRSAVVAFPAQASRPNYKSILRYDGYIASALVHPV